MLTTPVVRCLAEQSNVEIDFLTKSKFAAVLAHNPYIRKVITINNDVLEVLADLKTANYTYVIDLHKNIRTFRLRRALGVPAFDFPKLNVKKWLLVNFKINRLPATHIVDRYMEAVASLGIKNDGKGLDFFINEAKIGINLSEVGLKKGKYYVFVVGAAHFTKQIPKEKLIEIAYHVDDPVILLGGKAEIDLGKEIVEKGGEKIHSFCGKTSLNESAWLIQQSKAVLTPDTGMMHIAAALKKPILAVWGNTVPEFGMFPYQTDYINLEVKDLSCRPCSKIGKKTCPKGHFKCMKNQAIEKAVEELNRI